MWSGDKNHEPRTKTGVRGLSARPGRVDGSELAGACGICEAIPQGNGCATIAGALAGNGRNGARPFCPRALWNPYFLLLAPAAASLSTLMAALIGGLAGYLGGVWARMAMAVTDVFLSLPWLFLLITARALMPLNVSPLVSVLVTFMLLGLLGWTTAARVLCATAGSLRGSDFVRQARAAGLPGQRLFWVHVVPNLKPVSSAVLDFGSGLHLE